MGTDTLVDNRPTHRPTPHRRPISHRAAGATSRGAPRPASTASRPAAPAGPRTHEGSVYRTTYLPPSLHAVIVGLVLLALTGGVALGVGLAIYFGR